MRTLLSGSLNNAKTIADSEVHGIIHLVALSIMTEGGKSIDHFKSFALSQSAVTHHDFTLVLAHDSMGPAQNQNLENAQSFLGKRMTVTFTYKHIKNGPERSFTGVITGVAFSQQYGDYGDVVLTGQGPTILLDGAPHIQSFGGSQITRLAFIAQEMFQKVLTTRFDFRVDCKSNNNLPYACQYNETQYNFLARTAEAYGEQFYYDGQTVHFGKLPEAEKPLELIYGRDVHEIQVQMNTRHVAHANYNEGKDKNTTMLARLMTSYSSVSAADKRTPLSDKAMDTISRYTRKGVIDALLRDVDSSKADPTDGARFWDGVDLLAWGIDTELKPDSSTKTGHNKFDEYDFVKIRKDLYDKFVSNIQKKYPNGAPYRPSNGHNPANDKGTHIHKQTANGPREVYSIPAQDFSRSAYWTTGDFYYKNKIKQRTGIQATKVAGYSIFWKEIK
jgi:hypothetical protein